MQSGSKQVLLISLMLAVIGSAQADITFENVKIDLGEAVNYTFDGVVTIDGENLSLNSYPWFGTENVSFYLEPNTGFVEVFVHDMSVDLLNFTKEPSVYLDTSSAFNFSNGDSVYYVYRNDGLYALMTTDSVGYSSFNTPFFDSNDSWFFTTELETPTTTTTILTTTTIIPAPTTTLYEGVYEVSDNNLLTALVSFFNDLTFEFQKDDGVCQIAVDNESFFGSPEILEYERNSEYVHPYFLNEGDYYWRVRCYYGGRWSLWSNTVKFEHYDIGKQIKFDWTVINN